MKQLIAIIPHDLGGYKAQVVGIPDISAVADTEEQALERVRDQITEWLKSARLVTLEVSAAAPDNPLLRFAGQAKDDPDFALYLEEIQRYRQEVEARECSDSSSTPTT